MLSFSISYWDLIKFPYFVDITEKGDRGWKQAQTQGEDRVTLWVSLLSQLLICCKTLYVHNLKSWGSVSCVHETELGTESSPKAIEF